MPVNFRKKLIQKAKWKESRLQWPRKTPKAEGARGQNAPQNWNIWVLLHFYVTIFET